MSVGKAQRMQTSRVCISPADHEHKFMKPSIDSTDAVLIDSTYKHRIYHSPAASEERRS